MILSSIGTPHPYFMAKGFRPLVVRAIKRLERTGTVAGVQALGRYRALLRIMDFWVRDRSEPRKK